MNKSNYPHDIKLHFLRWKLLQKIRQPLDINYKHLLVLFTTAISCVHISREEINCIKFKSPDTTQNKLNSDIQQIPLKQQHHIMSDTVVPAAQGPISFQQGTVASILLLDNPYSLESVVQQLKKQLH